MCKICYKEIQKKHKEQFIHNVIDYFSQFLNWSWTHTFIEVTRCPHDFEIYAGIFRSIQRSQKNKKK